MPATLTFDNGTGFNDYFTNFTFGSTISFRVSLYGPALSSPDGVSTSGSAFAFSMFSDAGGTKPVQTNDTTEGFAFTVNVNLDGTTTITNSSAQTIVAQGVTATPTATATATTTMTPTTTPTPTATPTPLPPGPAALTVSPKVLNFGNVNYAFAGSNSRTLHVTITNPKKYKMAAIVVSVTGPTGFTAAPSCSNLTIPAGGKLNCQITYTPTGLGAVSGTLVVTDNAGNSPQMVALTGAGTQGKLYTTPGALNFSKVAVNTSGAKTLTLKNRSASTFTVSSIATTNPVFVASQNCLGTILGKGDCSITVIYTPTATIKSAETLSIVDTPDDITRTVNLIGTGN